MDGTKGQSLVAMIVLGEPACDSWRRKSLLTSGFPYGVQTGFDPVAPAHQPPRERGAFVSTTKTPRWRVYLSALNVNVCCPAGSSDVTSSERQSASLGCCRSSRHARAAQEVRDRIGDQLVQLLSGDHAARDQRCDALNRGEQNHAHPLRIAGFDRRSIAEKLT